MFIASRRRVVIYYNGDVVIHRDIEELASSATDIVWVEVLGSRVRRISTTLPPSRRNREIHTVHRLRVIEVFKGSEEVGATIEVMQLGRTARHNPVNYSLMDFNTGEELILFMTSFNDGLPAVLLTEHQAVYRVVISVDDSVEVENYSKWNNLMLTMEDLERIADGYFGSYP